MKLNFKAWFKKRFTLNWANLNQNYVEHFFVAIFDLVFAEQKKKLNFELSLSLRQIEFFFQESVYN